MPTLTGEGPSRLRNAPVSTHSLTPVSPAQYLHQDDLAFANLPHLLTAWVTVTTEPAKVGNSLDPRLRFSLDKKKKGGWGKPFKRAYFLISFFSFCI